MKVILIDYGMGNLGSLKRSLEECRACPMVSNDPHALTSADAIVLPGVGAYADGMKRLGNAGWIPILKKTVLERNVPLLGICLGMQLLSDWGEEGGRTQGLGLIPGYVNRLAATSRDERIPHVGWNEVRQLKSSLLFEGITDMTDFYFVHSYQFHPSQTEHTLATTAYAGGFVSAVQRDHLIGVQFHPEKSQKPGLRFLSNFVQMARTFHA